jgi:hypothetical protein
MMKWLEPVDVSRDMSAGAKACHKYINTSEFITMAGSICRGSRQMHGGTGSQECSTGASGSSGQAGAGGEGGWYEWWEFLRNFTES